ncbi:MAG: C4-type zinc ribbon domain-containing protein [Chloroflexota bacterium]
MSGPRDLYALQQLDTQLFSHRADLNETQQALAEPSKLVAARQLRSNLEEKLQSTGGSIKNLELELGTLQEKLSRSTNRLYSGEVKNPKELGDLQSEVDSLNGRKDTFELEMMEIMEGQEELNSKLAKTNEVLETLETNWAAESKELKIKQGEIALKMKKLLGKRKEKAAAITPSILTSYQKLLQSKQGLAIVKINGNTCTGCKIGMDGGTVRRVNSGELVNCPNCGRYLIR